MRSMTTGVCTLLATTALALSACESLDNEGTGADSLASVAMLDSTMLDPATIDSLASLYPVLQPQPAPPPTPRAMSTPQTIPERVRAAAPQRVLQTVRGEATYYADMFEGRRTASGIPFRQNQMVAAHRGFPFGTVLRVTNLGNDREVTVRVVDRGPWGAKAEARNTIIDLSRRAANQLGYVSAGRTPVQVEVLEWGTGVRAGA